MRAHAARARACAQTLRVCASSRSPADSCAQDGSPVSIFVFDLANRSETEKEAARNALKRCKTIKHPYIVRFVDGAEMADNKGGGMLYIVTEPISPLEPELKREGGLPQPALAWGLRSIVSAVAFLHKGGMMHANVHLSSIFVNKAGDWKLSGLELVCSPHTGGADALGAVKELLPRKLQSPELARGQLAVLEQADAGVTDSWLLGVLVYEVFNGRLERAEQLKNTTRLPPALVKHYTQLLSGTAPTRLRAAELLGNAFLNHAYCGTQEFVENLNVQDAAEKERFFATLTEHVSEIPPAAAKYKFLPALIQNLEYGGGSARILTPMLHIAKALSEDEFQRQVVPIVSKLFANNDRAMRMPLLELLPSFVASVPERVLNENIFPSMCNGFVDASAQLREMTVKAMVPLAPRLNQRSLGHVLRAFANLQRDEEAAIRTNTTICLGKITQYLDPTSRQRVLIAAFSRALLDPFPPARRAGALSLAATQSFHSAADCARKIVPAVAPLAIDPDPDVRKAALQCLAVYMAKLDGESRRMAARDAGEEEPSVPDAMAVATNVAQESVMESMTWVSSMLGKVGLSAAAAAAAKAAEAAKAASAKPKEADPSKPAMLTPTPAAPAPAPTPAAPTPACGGGAGGDGMGVGAGAAGKPPMQPAAPPMQPAATARPPQPAGASARRARSRTRAAALERARRPSATSHRPAPARGASLPCALAAPPNVNAGGVSSSNLSDLLGDADFDTAFSEPFAPPPAPPAGQGTPVAAGGASGGLARADSGASGGGATPAKPAKLAAHKVRLARTRREPRSLRARRRLLTRARARWRAPVYPARRRRPSGRRTTTSSPTSTSPWRAASRARRRAARWARWAVAARGAWRRRLRRHPARRRRSRASPC